MWSPMGPHVQWDLSNVVTYGTSYTVEQDLTGGWIIRTEMEYVKRWRIHVYELNQGD